MLLKLYLLSSQYLQASSLTQSPNQEPFNTTVRGKQILLRDERESVHKPPLWDAMDGNGRCNRLIANNLLIYEWERIVSTIKLSIQISQARACSRLTLFPIRFISAYMDWLSSERYLQICNFVKLF